MPRYKPAVHVSLSIQEDVMRRYEQVSGVFFVLVAVVQLVRLLMRWPVQVASVSVPLWASGTRCADHCIAGCLGVPCCVNPAFD